MHRNRRHARTFILVLLSLAAMAVVAPAAQAACEVTAEEW